MKWGEAQNTNLMDYFRRLIHLRRAQRVLVHGARRVLHLEAERGVYAYARESAAERVLVAINISDHRRVIDLPWSGGLPDPHDRLNGCPVHVDGDHLQIELPPHCGAFVA